MKRVPITGLAIALAFILLWSLLAQVAIPYFAYQMARWDYPDVPAVQMLWLPYSIASVLVILCGQVAIYFIYRLLRLVLAGTIFSAPTARYTGGIVICFGIATGLSALVTLAQLLIPDGGHFTTLFLTTSATFVGLALTLLMVVMRGLLNSAVAYRGELDQVI